jgi:oligogalacturonide transport system substrate-binding protein
MKKKLLSVICMCTMLISLTACGAGTGGDGGSGDSGSEDEITLRFSWWGGDSRHQATLDVIELYESKHPGIKIEAEYGGADGYKDKRMTEMAGKNAPDIMQIDAPWLYEMQTQFDAFADLSQFEDVLDMSGFDEDFVNSHCALDGTIYGLPTGINGTYMLMNTAILDAAGIDSTQEWTWDSLLEDGAKVHASDPEAYFLNLDQHSLTYHVLRPYIKQLFDEGVMEPASESFMYIDAFYDNPIWVNNKVGADIDWTSSLSARMAGFADTAAVTKVPQMENAKDTGILVRPAQIMCISNTSEHQKEAAEFIDFFLNDEEAISILKLERSVPATEAARQQLTESGDLDEIVNSAVNLALENAGATENAISQDMQLENILTDAVENVGYGTATPEEIAKETYGLLFWSCW